MYKANLKKRLQDHGYRDEWCIGKTWGIEYFECENRSEAEAFESHLIALYGTGEYYNKSKVNWGINKYLPDTSSKWKPIGISNYADYAAFEVGKIIRICLRTGKTKEARELMNELVFEYD